MRRQVHPHLSTASAQPLSLVQALRALAALLIVFHHAQFDASLIPGVDFTPLRALPWDAGVDIFFVISGFIMVHASGSLFAQPGARRTFLLRRLTRIVPIYWLATACMLAALALVPGALNGVQPRAVEIAASFLFIPVINGLGIPQPVLSLGWTLNYEMAFYLVFAVAVALPRAQAIMAVATFFIGLSALGWLVELPMPLSFWASPMVLEFVFGMGIGWLRTTGGRAGIVMRVVLAAFAVRMLQADLTQEGVERAFAWGVPAAMLVAAAVLGREPRWQGPFMRALVLLGDASYALYLFHPFALRALRMVLTRTNVVLTLGPWGYIALAVLAAIVLALAVHFIIERPLNGWLRRLTGAGGRKLGDARN